MPKMQNDLCIDKLCKSPETLSPILDGKSEDYQRFNEDSKNVLGLSNAIATQQGITKKNGLTGQSGLAHVSGASGLSNSQSLCTSIHTSQPHTDSSPVVSSSLDASTSSLWSTTSVDDSFLNSMQPLNSARCQNQFAPYSHMHGPSQSTLMVTSPQGQYGIAKQNFNQRRPITASHNVPPSHPQNPHMGKGYPAWPSVSGSEQNSWGMGAPGPAQQNYTTLSSWDRAQQVSGVNPMAPLPAIPGNISNMNQKYTHSLNQAGGGVVFSPNKFRRSTLYPTKGLYGQPPPAYNGQQAEENDLGYQVGLWASGVWAFVGNCHLIANLMFWYNAYMQGAVIYLFISHFFNFLSSMYHGWTRVAVVTMCHGPPLFCLAVISGNRIVKSKCFDCYSTILCNFSECFLG